MRPKLKLTNDLFGLILFALLSSLPVAAQSVRVEVSKRANKIPRACQSIVPASIPASINDPIDVPALVKEARCKGAGDMLSDYTYVMRVSHREKEKKGNIKEDTTTYEVFIPTLKSGMHTKGILLMTSRNGVPVPAAELEKERLKTGERLEKEENKIAQADAPAAGPENSPEIKGLLPLGVYNRSGINRSSFGSRTGGASLSILDFLANCDLMFLRREPKDGREVLVFRFTPRPDAKYDVNNKYMAQLTGEVWIDATDRIVTRLAGWPRDPKATTDSLPALVQTPPAVYVELMRLREGIWLPRVFRINGMDYPTLFDHVTGDRTSTYSDYIRFTTEVNDVKVNP
jgi:hypothetical protein